MSTANEAPIFSSTGSLGVSRRQDERLYANATRFSTDPSEVIRNFGRLAATLDMQPERIGRVVFRGLVSADVLDEILASDLCNDLEVVLPVHEFGQTGSLAYMARNRRERTAIVPIDDMIYETTEYPSKTMRPLERVQSALQQGYAFTSRLHAEDIHQVHSLWGPTFGWSVDEVANLARRLEAESQLSPEARSDWLIMVKNGKEVVSIAMAERLSIPASEGRLEMIENTEWCTSSDYGGRGLMTAALTLLNTQILNDMDGNTPLIFAECNFQSRSDRAGYGAGFRIPERTPAGYPAPQVLVQNVGVNDRQPVEVGKLRDFTFMYLPRTIIQQVYSPEQTARVIETAQIG